MIKRIAIPVQDGHLSEYFGGCSHYRIYELDKTITGMFELQVPGGIAITGLPSWLSENGINDVIVYKANPEIIREFALQKINLFMGVAIDTPENIIEAYRKGWLESDAGIIKALTLPAGNR